MKQILIIIAFCLLSACAANPGSKDQFPTNGPSVTVSGWEWYCLRHVQDDPMCKLPAPPEGVQQ